MNVITIENLTKAYNDKNKAVDNLNLTIDEGAIFGFLGPNGAGKTTTVKLLSGICAPSGGSCRVFGMNPAKDPEKVHALSGIVTEHAQMYDTMTGLQNLIFYGMLFGAAKEAAASRATELLGLLDLAQAKDKKLSAYSTGMRQRLSLARAMMHSPKILFLDEPTSGLDPESTQSVNNLIQRLAKNEGITIFLCTHQLRYAQEICTEYGLLDKGRLLAAGNFKALQAMMPGGLSVRIRTDENIHDERIESEADIPDMVGKLVREGRRIYHVSLNTPSLEDIYFALIDAKKEEGGKIA
jgi:ABC-2 type transport system ATP-binding protein